MSSTNQTSLSSLLLSIQHNALFVISWFYVTFGIAGCFLNILLFSKKQFRQISCCTYFLVASVAMFIQLVIYSVPSIYAFYYFNPMSYYPIYCKVRMYLVLSPSLIYNWSYAASTFDRYALSSANARLRQLAKVKIAVRVLVVICLVSLTFSIYVPVVYEIKSSTCSIFNNPSATLFTTLSTILLNTFIPTMIIIVYTLLIWKNLKEKRQRRQQLFNRENNNSVQQKQHRQALRMLFLQYQQCYFILHHK
ncbi:unnamed protein product [Adineta ricciae]|uniref:G-protein coupled receptors family 1 profile domain-containing protein n=1 Tax=Adineta ricciae TaxID=249248 RepID=A0A816EQR8_ADIRI|nr:unnamed protein product [Adineta ricciae]